jgi:ABC-type lipoprotein export system ATPase subunit
MESAFDVPAQEKCALHWKGELPIEDQDWNIGLIVGPSGCGKSSLLSHVFGAQKPLTWDAPSVIDDFAAMLSIETITKACQSVGFNTIPAWLRPYGVLSNGERFRADIARRMLETPADEAIVIDEFTSVVDRQVAQIASHAVQKFVRRGKRKMVVASCHYDIVDWLQPDWILEPGTMSFTRRLLRQRPELSISISRVNYAAWQLFAPFHYLTASLHRAAACYLLSVNDRPAALACLLHRPHAKVRDIMGVSRVVTLPDYQGLGLAFVLMDTLGQAIKAIGKRLHMYPAHPALISSMDRSPVWALVKKPGQYSPMTGKTTSIGKTSPFGGRACAVFCYAGPAMKRDEAERLLCVEAKTSGAQAALSRQSRIAPVVASAGAADRVT